MAYPQVIIPPSVKPVSPLELAPADDRTVSFQPRFSRGTTQRQTWGDPIWSAQVRFESLSGADRALVKAAIMGARGGASNILLTPGIPLRGSFPATELLTNNDFSNGTTGYTAGPDASISVQDKSLRVKRTSTTSGSAYATVTSAAQVQYAPYAFRAVIASIAGGVNPGPTGGSGTVSISANDTGATPALRKTVLLATAASAPTLYLDNVTPTGYIAGDYYDVSWCSYSRCILADSQPNAALYSDQLDNAAWTKSACSITAGAATAPDGTATADEIVENSATASHYILQTPSRTSQVEDVVAFGCFHRGSGTRDVRVDAGDGGSNYSSCIFDLGAGTAGSVTNNGTATNGRAFIADLGTGWFFCAVVSRAPASVTMYAEFMLVNAGTTSYLGNGTSSIYAWRCGYARSSFPVRPAQTTTVGTAGTSQTGTGMYVKGLPVSTSGLLLAGDFVEINGDLMQVTASLDSDAAGRGVLQIHRRPTTAIADNTPIIVNNPFGRFRLASDPRIVERFGVYTDVDLQLIEATA